MGKCPLFDPLERAKLNHLILIYCRHNGEDRVKVKMSNCRSHNIFYLYFVKHPSCRTCLNKILYCNEKYYILTPRRTTNYLYDLQFLSSKTGTFNYGFNKIGVINTVLCVRIKFVRKCLVLSPQQNLPRMVFSVET